MNRDELNKSIDECEAVLSIKELNKWLKIAKEEFPEAKIQYKLKEKEEALNLAIDTIKESMDELSRDFYPIIEKDRFE